jgi:hypothetical protein
MARLLFALGALPTFLLGGCGLAIGLGDFTDAPDDATATGTSTATSTGSSAGGAGGESTSSSAGGGGAGGGPSPVNGTQNINYVTEFAQKTVHPDLTGVAIAAIVDNGTTFDVYEGEGHLDGSFTIPDVPAGPYYLRLDTPKYTGTFFYTSSRQVDLSYYQMGRDTQTVPVASTPLTLTVSGMAPWAAADTAELVCVDARVATFGLEAAATMPIPLDATGFTATLDTKTEFFPGLIAATDITRVLQMTPATTNLGNSYLVTTKAAEASLSQVDGQPLDVSIGLDDIVETGDAKLRWTVQSFEALGTQTNPTSIHVENVWYLDALPGSPANGFYGPAPDLLTVRPAFGVNVDDSFPFYNPFNPNWFLLAVSATNFRIPLALPGAAPTNAIATIGITAPKSYFDSTTVVPLLTPAQNPTVDGKPFFTDAAISTLNPVVAWQAPATGTPSRYTIRTVKLYVQGGNTRQAVVGILVTNGTQVKIPPGFLEPGLSYYFKIQALYNEGADFDAHPASGALPLAQADVVSAIMTAP